MRSKKPVERKLKPDGKFNSTLVTKFINYIMLDGRKATARHIVYEAIDGLAKASGKEPFAVFETAIENVKPKIEVRSRRVGGANLQVPTPVNPKRQTSLAFRWIIDSARSTRKNTSFAQSLSKELLSAFNKEGTAFKKKEEVHRMAEANKAFAQFA